MTSAVAWHGMIAVNSAAALPLDAIIGFNSSDPIPTGFTSEAPNRFIRCGTSGGTGGSHSLGSAGTSGGGNHGSHSGSRFTRDPGGSAPEEISSQSTNQGNHTHSVSLSYRPAYGAMKLIRVTAEEAEIPKDGITFSHQASLDAPVAHYSGLDGYLLWGHAGNNTIVGDSKSASSNNASFSHVHHGTGRSSAGGPFGPTNRNRPSGGPSHSHSVSMSISVSVYAHTLKAFYNTEEGGSCENMIVIFAGSTIPEGWVYCDGTNGTPNLHERIIKLGTSIGPEGNATYSCSGSLSSAGSHNHSQPLSGNEWLRGYAHDNNVSHSHSYSKSGGYTPTYQDYRFIMKTG